VLGLVVEGDVPADDRDPQREAGIGQAEHGPVELPGDVRLLRVAEVEAVGQAERLGSHTGQVLRALEHGFYRAGVGIAGDAAPVAVDRNGDGPVGLGDHQDCRIRRLWPPRGARADHRVVLLERPAL
jgi:hypothetical protein